MLYLEQCNADEVEMVNSRQDGSELRPNRLIFYAVFLLGTAPLSILLADDSVESHRYSVARGHGCATNCDRKHLDIGARSNELLGSNIRNNTIFELPTK